LCRWLMSCAGLEREGDTVADTTIVAAARSLAYYSSTPYWLEDYRPGRATEKKTAWLLSVYNRQLAGKGQRNPFGIRSSPIRGTLVISGESCPTDNAVLTRCVVLRLAPNRFTSAHYEKLNTCGEALAGVALSVMGKSEEELKAWDEDLVEFTKFLKAEGADARSAANWAIPASGWCHGANVEPESGEVQEFLRWVLGEAHATKVARDSETVSAQFWDELVRLRHIDALDGSFIRVNETHGRMFLAVRPAWSLYAEHMRRRGEDPYPYPEIMRILKESPWVEKMNEIHKLGEKNARCAVIDYYDAPDFVRDLAHVNGHGDGDDE